MLQSLLSGLKENERQRQPMIYQCFFFLIVWHRWLIYYLWKEVETAPCFFYSGSGLNIDDTSVNLELWPAARFIQLSPQVLMLMINSAFPKASIWRECPRVYSYVWQTLCACLQIRMCMCQKLALTSSLLSCMFYLTNGETIALSKAPTSINNHEAKLQGSAAVTVEMIGTMQMQGAEPIYSGS